MGTQSRKTCAGWKRRNTVNIKRVIIHFTEHVI